MDDGAAGSVLSFFMKNGRSRAFISWEQERFSPVCAPRTGVTGKMSVKKRQAILILILIGVTALTVFLFLPWR